MIDNRDLATDGDSALGSLAVELTVAAYPIALRHGLKGLWLDLEIDLWMVLVKTVQKWFRQAPRFEWPGDSGSEREDFVAELTDAAYSTTLKYRVQGSFLDLELGLYHAFSQVAQDIGQGTTSTARCSS